MSTLRDMSSDKHGAESADSGALLARPSPRVRRKEPWMESKPSFLLPPLDPNPQGTGGDVPSGVASRGGGQRGREAVQPAGSPEHQLSTSHALRDKDKKLRRFVVKTIW
ncbi:putative dynein heavy chain 7 axonemal [Scophthalmus maximus]|uniref:Putative dynein heavy chain 7 axonemal n=1 Tax=Scophthalmus maximus TaxID=52904 RepID=A0A2U9C8F3_SCOMX|nr:putative dynein heavy chain 7 axonemal [Scophthalmus maximus]